MINIRPCRKTPFPLLPYLLPAFLLLLFPAARAESPAPTGEVTWVYDGDTLEVSGLGTVRLLGIDVPERQPSGRDRFFTSRGIAPARLRQIHDQATSFVIDKAKRQVVGLLFEKEIRDRHDRLLAYVVLPDGRNLNRLLLEEGLAVVYRRFDFGLKDEFLAAEREARRRKLGLWQNAEALR